MEMLAAVLVVISAIGFVTLVLIGLVRMLRAERAVQPIAQRTPLWAIALPAATIVAVSVWWFDDPRAGFRVGTAGIIVVGLAVALCLWWERRQ